ncbi:WD40 repeat domain-containing protein [Nonomuraea sp. MTCD27]
MRYVKPGAEAIAKVTEHLAPPSTLRLRREAGDPDDKYRSKNHDLKRSKSQTSVAKAGRFAGFTPGSKAYATDKDGGVRLFDLATGKARATLTATVRGDLVFSPDGNLIAAVTTEGEPALFDAATGQGLTPLTGHTGKVTDLAFTADGQALFTTGTDKTVRKWYVKR